MKFIDDETFITIQLEAEDGRFYRTNKAGAYWECLYGESWEPVYLTEEDACIAAFKSYFGVE